MDLFEYEFFNDIKAEDRERIEQSSKYISLPIGSQLYYEGDVNQDILFLKHGKVKVYITPENIGKGEITLYYISAGEQCLVNTFSTVTQTPTLASAVVDESIEGWLIPKDNILWLINNSQNYRDFKIELCGERLGIVMDLIKSIKFDQLDQRLLNWLYVQGKNTIKITHEKIANILGVSREAISRNLKKLEKSGNIKLSRGYITLL
ncbi:Crp/Fnr family transcriptional regulator [Sulfurimonas lithotrophica]|uniref:Crp/Fnr family transcriptional regulator n=1 Tax=Sulfurimonas lithotrophica TaxID=2590022 RepID=A0A5P8P2Z0_9BACT|nr:Crp/Fnr family transcriptional regulator [Sulfurimonas lithotrophica]QFR49930.1 Crp/Fnr family transcriptional regulator [Sulfurimonas lithotrophica]